MIRKTDYLRDLEQGTLTLAKNLTAEIGHLVTHYSSQTLQELVLCCNISTMSLTSIVNISALLQNISTRNEILSKNCKIAPKL